MDWNTAPEDVLIHVFVNLNLADLMSVSVVSHLWHEVARHNAVWSGISRKWLPEKEIKDPSKSSYYDQIKSFFFSWGKYKHEYQPIKTALDVIESVLKIKSPVLALNIGEGLSENEISEVETKHSFRLDSASRIVYRLCNGQKKFELPLFGSYHFYDYQIFCYLLPLQRAAEIRAKFPAHLQCMLPVVFGSSAKITFLVLDSKNEFGLEAGTLVDGGTNFDSFFHVANSMIELFEQLGHNLKSENWEIKDGLIDRFPSKFGISKETTQGIQVDCCPLFIPELSRVKTGKFYFSYKIKMRMSPDCKEPKSQLQTRHWEIKDETNRVEIVDGPGVIGLYPTVYPGSYFDYESCCSSKTKTGSMKGSFNMKSELGHNFDVVVPEFFFVTPKFYSK